VSHDGESLTRALIERGVLADGVGPMPASHTQRPWFIGALLGMAGWLAGLFVLLFVAILFKPTSPLQFVPIGLVLIAAAFALYAIDKESAFFDQLALALSIAGQSALIWAAEGNTTDGGTAALTLVLQLAMLAIMPNRLAKLIAAFFACVAWALTIRFTMTGADELWGRNQAVSLASSLTAWFIVWTPLVIAAEGLIRTETQWVATRFRGIARAALTGILASLAIATWFTEPFASLSLAPPGEQRSNWLALWPLLAVVLALFAMFCAFRIRSSALIGLAIAGALLHVSHFYYLLGTTLLIKSCLLLAMGSVLLIASVQLRKGARQ
jgi:Domain of unknown function (DUF4401)